MKPMVFFVASTAAIVAAIGLWVYTSPADGAAGPARVQVAAFDFDYRLSRQRVRAGRVVIELVNFGEDEHDLALRRVGGRRTYALPKTLPGERRVLSLRLAPGRYRLWCRLGDHAVRGMRSELRVVR